MSFEPIGSGDSSAELILKLSSEIAAAYVSRNALPASDVPMMLKAVHAALAGLSGARMGEPAVQQKPAVPIKRSITPDYIVCLEDGKKLKMLKRYLRSRYGLSPEAYRIKWGLPIDYPMVAPNYAARRSAFAKQIGLGKSPPKSKGRRRG